MSHNDLHELIAALTGQSEAKNKLNTAMQNMADRGIKPDDLRTFRLMHRQVPSLAEALALAQTLNHFNTGGHLPACKFGLATIDFLKGATAFMYGVLDRAHIDPDDFGMKPDPDQFFKYLNESEAEFTSVLNKLNAGPSTDGVSRAACE